MSSYNENLHASVVASLQSQELELKKVESQQNASMFTLYYAEAATITAGSLLTEALDTLVEKTSAKAQAVTNNNITVNLLDSATQASQYVKQSTSNSSICAANVQVATNAVVRLASNMGSIYSIVNAADAGTDIFRLASEARRLIDDTAYNAEVASQSAMEASVLTSEVTSSVVLDKAKVTSSYMTNMLKITSSDFSNSLAAVTAKNDGLAAVSAAEKKSEGTFKDLSVDLAATISAYSATNQGLNLDLKVSNESPYSFRVSFDLITTPFEDNTKETHYPVKNYYLMVVKDTRKSTFTVSNAENILINGVHVARPEDKKDGNDTSTTQYIPVILPPSSKDKTAVSQKINYQFIQISGYQDVFELNDSDGDAIELGQKYVVFLLADYYDDYKKKLNNFDEYLSAPSAPFVLSNLLLAVDGRTIKADEKNNNRIYFTTKVKKSVEDEDIVDEIKQAIEFRAILLPADDPFANGLLNESGFEKFTGDVVTEENIAENFDPEISETLGEVVNLTKIVSELEEKIGGVKENSALYKEYSQQLELQSAKLENYKQILTSLEEEKALAEARMNHVVNDKLGFLFNLTLAQQVLPGNYLVAIYDDPDAGEADSDTPKKDAIAKRKEKKSGANTHVPTSEQPEFVELKWYVDVDDATTDNFGNPLVDNGNYLPVVLSISKADEATQAMFTSNWSGYRHSAKYEYKSTNN